MTKDGNTIQFESKDEVRKIIVALESWQKNYPCAANIYPVVGECVEHLNAIYKAW